MKSNLGVVKQQKLARNREKSRKVLSEPLDKGQAIPPEALKPPGRTERAQPMLDVAVALGDSDHIRKLLKTAFCCADRVLLRTPWGDYVIFRRRKCFFVDYFLFDGCTCNPMRFRYFDLDEGTYGLRYIKDLREVIKEVVHVNEHNGHLKNNRKLKNEDLCKNLRL